MSSQERWFVVIEFLNGPLSFQGEMPLRGPVIRLGANPGPGGLRLEGYRGLDDRQAVITAYDGGTASVAPVGPNQVRMAPHEHVNWNEVQPIRGPVYLSNGCAIHFGPPERGATVVFKECKRLGAWEQGAILSDASQLEPDVQPTEVKELDASRRFPWWVIPIAFGILTMFLTALAGVLFVVYQSDVVELGPVEEGQEDFGCRGTEACEEVLAVKVNETLLEGLDQAFLDFLMRPNAEAAEWPELQTNTEKWDRTLMEWVTRAESMHGAGWKFWIQLDDHASEYATVLTELRNAKLPEVFAAIPFQESRYNGKARDMMLCAYGYWQFQPEVANRAGLGVRDCKLRGRTELWTPTELAPPIGVRKNAIYVENDVCQISGCAVDERSDLRRSTKGAIQLLGEAYADKELRYSGAVTQIVIASHNAGYNNEPYQGKVNVFNMLPAYRRYVKDANAERAPDFIGKNITCVAKGQAKDFTDRCGGALGSVTQHYVPYVIAQHLLAVCYYGANYASDIPAFQEYAKYLRSGGYCKDIRVPSRAEVESQRKGK